MILFELTNQNLILGFMPESLGLLLFGIGLIGLTIGLRWIFKHGEENANREIEGIAQKAKLTELEKEMSVEFRQRTAGEFIKMLKRRKWLIFLPILTMTVAIGYVVYKLPSVYESKTLLTVKPPRFPKKSCQHFDGRRFVAASPNHQYRSFEPLIARTDDYEIQTFQT